MNPIFLHRFDKRSSAGVVDVLVAFTAAPELDERALAAAVENEIEQRLAPDEMIVVLRQPAVDCAIAALSSSRQGMALKERLADRCGILVLGYDAKGRLARREVVASGPRTAAVDLNEIVRRGVTSIFRDHGGFVEASASYHFANPSGRHTDRFMRLSNILVRQAEISFVALAVMPHIPGAATQAYIDTPALYSVVSAINEQWRTLDPTRPSLNADNFGSYGRLESHRFTDLDRSMAIVSASSSGSLADRLVASGFQPANIVHVLFLGPARADLVTAIDLVEDSASNPLGYSADRKTFQAADCKLCRQGSLAISLKGDQFDISGPQPGSLVVKRAHAPKSLSATMGRLVGLNALAVTTASQQFRVLPSQLLRNRRSFRDRLDYFVRRHVPASVAHVVTVDESSEPVFDRIREVAGFAFDAVDRGSVETLTDGSSSIHGAILIVAGSIGSGRALLDVSRDLRNAAPEAPLIYLVGVAKTESQGRLDMLRRSLIQTDRPVSHLVEFVETLILPSSSHSNPWVEELTFLNTSEQWWPAAAVEMLEARRNRLRRASEPMVDDLFVRNGEDHPMPLRDGFVFWPDHLPVNPEQPHTQADVFFTVASVLQQLRSPGDTSAEQALRNNWLQQTLLSPENFGRFNDGIIQASFLRAARPAELDFRDNADASGEAGRIVRRIIDSSNRPRGEATAEFLIALGTGRMRLCRTDSEKVLAPLTDAPPMVAALLEVVRSTLLEPGQQSRQRRRRRRPSSGQ